MSTPSTKAQAEAMASKLVEALYSEHLEYDSNREHRFEYHVKTSHTAITAFLSTALEKLLADIERLRAREAAMVQADPRQLWNLATFELKEQLTATEARLETAINLLQLMRTYHGKPRREEWLNEPAFLEVKSIDGRVSSFLSTLTAEKKKVYTPPPAEELHWDCPKCGCCNRFYLGRTKAPCSECGAEKKEEVK